jgi:APA family basic amino acid/polyamine antiporter
VLVLRKTQPDRHRPFRTPLIWLFAPLSVVGCVTLFAFLPWQAQILFPVWSLIGLAFYFAYGYRHSHVARGHTDVPETEIPGPISK